MNAQQYLQTPDGRYFVVKGRLWRCSNPELEISVREGLVSELMDARRSIGRALVTKDEASITELRVRVLVAKVGLGERGAVWWADGAPDYSRRLVKNSPYAFWYESAVRKVV